jgi:hypothetical protein
MFVNLVVSRADAVSARGYRSRWIGIRIKCPRDFIRIIFLVAIRDSSLRSE